MGRARRALRGERMTVDLHHVVEVVGIMVAGLLFYSYAYPWLAPGAGARWRRPLLHGVAFGVLAVGLMKAAIQVGPGGMDYVDARLLPIALVGLFEGGPAALIAAAVAAAYRLAVLGGPGAWAGVLMLALTAAGAWVAHAWAARSPGFRWRHVAALAALTYAATVIGHLAAGAYGRARLGRLWDDYLAVIAIGLVLFARLFEDVVRRHRLAAELHRFRSVLDGAREAIRIVEADSLIVLDANRADAELTGFPREEVVGRSLRQLWPSGPVAWTPHEETLSRALEAGTAERLGLPLRTRSGAEVLVDVTLRTVAHAGRRYLAMVARPAEERLAAEAAERERAELRTVSLTARAAAHEINNPLAVISGYLQLLEPRHAADTREGSWLRQMLDAAVRIRDSVDRLNRVTRIATTPTTETRPPMLDTHRSSGEPAPPAAAPRQTPPSSPAP